MPKRILATHYCKNKESKGFSLKTSTFSIRCTNRSSYPLYSSETVSLALPFERRDANTLRPFALAILVRKPCLFFLFLFEGWNVLFISMYILFVISYPVWAAKIVAFL